MSPKGGSKGALRPSPRPAAPPKRLLGDLRRLIDEARKRTARFVNSELVMLHWNIGRRIRTDLLKGQRARYGEEIVSSVSLALTAEYGQGFGRRNLFYMVRMAEAFPDPRIVHALSAQLSWTHFRILVGVEEPLRRDFYAEMSRLERWTTRTLEKKIGGLLYERTALSRKPEETIRKELQALREEDQVTPDLIFRDPYFLDFLGLRDAYGEKDVESAILRELEHFILELGAGFAFIARKLQQALHRAHRQVERLPGPAD